MIIVDALNSDLDLLAKMNRELIQDEGHRNNMDIDQLKTRMENWITHEYAAVLFKHEEKILGYALWREEAGYIYLRQFFVTRESRNRHIGTNAFNQLSSKYWKNLKVRLDVLVNNTIAQKFWASVGFKNYCITMELPAVKKLSSR